ncbi:PAS domain-containing protein [Lichenibacterium dinghuense]|uniref:PAS domain-containing protein n=1 Tax=Lichenibacterium dinghuense TaxID=2895977 RepID=UPI001F465A87|nr:PAS domain-containing protein [Lichenibacterium sp. 6Y81]
MLDHLAQGMLIGEAVRDGMGRIVDWRCLDVNAAWEGMAGQPRAHALGRPFRDVVPHVGDAFAVELERVVETGVAFRLERQVGASGRWYEGDVFRVSRDRLAITFLDVTDRVRADARRDALVRLGDVVRDVDDPVELAYAAAELLGRTLDLSRVGYAQIDHAAETLIVDRDWTAPGFETLAGTLRLRDYGSFIDAMKRGERVVIRDAKLDARCTAEQAVLLEARGARSFVNASVIEWGRLVAVFFVNCAEARDWTESDLQLIQDFADRTRVAVERLRSERAARTAAEALHELNATLEKRVAERSAELDRVWQNAQDLQVVIDADGVFLTVSPSATRLLGWAPEEMVGRSLFAFIHTDDDGLASRQALRQALTEPMPAHRNRYRHKNGGERWIEWRTTPEAGLVYCYGRDVTAEIEQAAALRDSEERETEVRLNNRRMQTALAAGAVIGTWIWDIPNDRFTVDEAFAEAFGLDPALGREGIPMAQIVATVHPNDQAGLADAIGAAIERGGRYAHQYRVLRVDGRYHWLEANGHVEHASDGTPLRFPGVLIEIAARRFDVAMNGLSERLRTLDTPQQMVMAASETAGQALGVTRVAYGDVDPAGQRIVVRPDWLAAGQSTIAGELAFSDFGSYIEDLRRGEDVVIDDVRLDPRTTAQVENLRGIGIRSLVNLPLMQQGRLKVVFFLNDCEPHAWSADELAFARRVVDRTEVEIARRAAEDGLRELNASLERQVEERTQERNQIWQVSRDMLMVSDLDGVWLSVNPALTRVLGWREDELVGRTSAWLRHPDDQALTHLQLRRLVAGEATSFENRFRTRAGDYRWMSWTAVPHEGRVYAVSRDVTEERAQAAALSERTEALRLHQDIVQSDGSPIVAFDHAYRVTAFNRAHGEDFLRVMGRVQEIGDVLPDLFPAEQAAALRGLMDRALAGERFVVVQSFGDPGREVPTWEITYTPLRDADGRVTGAFHHARDISERVRAEADLSAAQDALRQAQKMEAVGQLTGGVAHDFNNLLTVIKSSTDLLKRPNLSEERRARYVAAISDTADRAAKLTGQLLAFARRQALKPEVFAACDSVRALSGMMGTLTGSRIQIVTDLSDELSHVEVDPSQFDTALVNLAVNARDAMDGEGRITIAVRTADAIPAVRSHPERDGAYVAVSLSDTGSGIPADRIQRIFEPFFTTKEVGKGTGLGLSQVFGFAKQSGGDVAVDSTVGEGTTFTLYLPRVAAPSPAAAAEAPEALADGLGTRVLVVEDNADVGTFTVQSLSDLGYGTVLAADGPAALAELARDPDRFDVVFSDVMMPGMDGVELGQEIRRLYRDLPVVLTSGYSHVLAQNGTHGFELLHKPYSVEQLSQVLRKAAGWRRRKGAAKG